MGFNRAVIDASPSIQQAAENDIQHDTLSATFFFTAPSLGALLELHSSAVVRTMLSVPLYTATFTVNDLGDTQDAIPSDGTCAIAVNVRALRAVFFPS